MTYDQFASIVRSREYEAKTNPGWYRVRVVLLMALAYFFIALLFVVALALLGGAGLVVVGMIKSHRGGFSALRVLVPVVIGSLTFAALLLRSLWVTVPEPDGVSLARGQAVPLFQEIDKLRAQMKVAPFDAVLLVREMNAAVIQTPRLGIFGWQKNTLILGVPLMLTLSPDQFRAVIAHEMGHIGGNHSALAVAAYRMEHTWATLLHSLMEQEHMGRLPMIWFFSWYAPFFDAFTFALRRQDEFDADRAAAKAVGAKILADSLIHSELTMRAFAEPKENLPVSRQTAIKWLNDATHDAPHHRIDDTHPPLAARLRSLEQKAFLPEPFEQSAAERYFGHNLTTLAASVGITIRAESPAPDAAAGDGQTAVPATSASGLRTVGG